MSSTRLFSVILVGLALEAYSSIQKKEEDPNWNLYFEDNFDGTSLNQSTWNVWNNQTHGDKEEQLYFADEVSVSDGNLIIRTSSRDVMYGNKPYNFTSGWVDTSNKVEFLYGKIEADIKLPKELPGVWPAWWLVQDKGGYCWPVGGEIDILEAVGGFRNDSVFGTYHFGAKCGVDEWVSDHQRNGDMPHPPNSLYSDQFHTFTVFWNKTAITWAVDGFAYVSRVLGDPAYLFIPSWSQYAILNTAMSFWTGPQPPPREGFPVYMYVSAVRAYSWAGSSSGPGVFPIPLNVSGLKPQ